MATSEILMVCLTAVIAIAGVIGAIIFNNQLTAMQGQLDEMKAAREQTDKLIKAASDANQITKDNFIADQRPWVFLSEIRLISNLKYDAVNKALNLTFQFTAKNSGRSPAHDVRIDAILINQATQTQDRDIVVEQQKFAKSFCDREGPFFSYPLFPGEQSNPPVGIQLSLNKDDIANSLGAPERKVILPALIGCVSYQSPGQKARHETGFILTISVDNGYLPFDSTVQGDLPEVPLSRLRLTQYFAGWYAT